MHSPSISDHGAPPPPAEPPTPPLTPYPLNLPPYPPHYPPPLPPPGLPLAYPLPTPCLPHPPYPGSKASWGVPRTWRQEALRRRSAVAAMAGRRRSVRSLDVNGLASRVRISTCRTFQIWARCALSSHHSLASSQAGSSCAATHGRVAPSRCRTTEASGRQPPSVPSAEAFLGSCGSLRSRDDSAPTAASVATVASVAAAASVRFERPPQ